VGGEFDDEEVVLFVVAVAFGEEDDEVAVLFLEDFPGVAEVDLWSEGGVEGGVAVEFDGTGAGDAGGEVEVSDGKDGLVLEWDEVFDGGWAGEAGGVPGWIGSAVGEEAAVATDEEFSVGELSDGFGAWWGVGSLKGEGEGDFVGGWIFDDEVAKVEGLGEDFAAGEEVGKRTRSEVEGGTGLEKGHAILVAGFEGDVFVLGRRPIETATGPGGGELESRAGVWDECVGVGCFELLRSEAWVESSVGEDAVKVMSRGGVVEPGLDDWR